MAIAWDWVWMVFEKGVGKQERLDVPVVGS